MGGELAKRRRLGTGNLRFWNGDGGGGAVAVTGSGRACLEDDPHGVLEEIQALQSS